MTNKRLWTWNAQHYFAECWSNNVFSTYLWVEEVKSSFDSINRGENAGDFNKLVRFYCTCSWSCKIAAKLPWSCKTALATWPLFLATGSGHVKWEIKAPSFRGQGCNPWRYWSFNYQLSSCDKRWSQWLSCPVCEKLTGYLNARNGRHTKTYAGNRINAQRKPGTWKIEIRNSRLPDSTGMHFTAETREATSHGCQPHPETTVFGLDGAGVDQIAQRV